MIFILSPATVLSTFSYSFLPNGAMGCAGKEHFLAAGHNCTRRGGSTERAMWCELGNPRISPAGRPSISSNDSWKDHVLFHFSIVAEW